MSLSDTQKLWKLALEDLQVTVSQASFNGWIRPLILTTIEEGRGFFRASVRCPSSFHQSIIEQRFAGAIKEALSRAIEGKVELNFVIGSMPTKPTEVNVGPLFAHQTITVDAYQLALHKVGLRGDFTFDTFAVSSSNEMAHAAAVAVSRSLGSAYNPLFFYGGVGVGKTHLMQAVAIEALKQDPGQNFIYCAGEEFTNEIIDAIQQKTTRNFKKRYREVKGLFIDDIQFIAGKTTVQEEFFHTFNAILKGGGQVVMTSDRPPSEIKALESRLRSRFEAGLIVDIGNPDFELRTAIVLIKSRQRSIHLDMEAAQSIAASIESARQIEGFLVRLTTEAQLRGREITTPLINEMLGTSTAAAHAIPPKRPIEVIRKVADHFNLTVKDVRGVGRARKFVTPRHVSMYLLRVDYNLPLTEVGELFSNRDHTTVMHAVNKVAEHLKDSESLRTTIETIRKELYTY